MKKALIYLAGIVVLILGILIALVVITPEGFRVEREVVINKPKDQVFNYMVKLRNQEKWGPWVKKDPKVKLKYTGEDGTEGFVSRWESDHEELGTGEQEIKKIDPGKRVDLELRFEEPWESVSDAYYITAEDGPDKTKVKWGFTGKMAKPMNLLLIFTDFEGLVGKDFEEGLAALKTEVEKLPEPEKEESDDKDSKEGAESEEKEENSPEKESTEKTE